MTSSAFFGIFLSFLPSGIVECLNVEPITITTLFLKIMSALYLGFGILNWMAKGTLIGGIYNRPIAILMHFGVGVIALVKIASKIQAHSEIIISLTAMYVIFVILFANVFRTNSTKAQK
mgnify:CR=1 FL=1